VGEFMAAEYTICVDAGPTEKEIIKCLVIAGLDRASITMYGKTSLSNDLINLIVTVDDSKLKLAASPIGTSEKKLIFSSNYYHSITDIAR
jgi:hypothetical protein